MRWNCDIIRNTDTNEYRALIEFENCVCEVEAYGWRELCANVKRDTGIRFPMKKYFKFEKFSDFEQIAGIDASHARPSCIVTMKDRRNGWKRWNFQEVR